MDSEYQSLLARIQISPANDELRHELAQWLRTHENTDLARFIELQLHIAEKQEKWINRPNFATHGPTGDFDSPHSTIDHSLKLELEEASKIFHSRGKEWLEGILQAAHAKNYLAVDVFNWSKVELPNNDMHTYDGPLFRADFKAFIPEAAMMIIFNRGLPESLYLYPGANLDDVNSVLAAAPTITKLKLAGPVIPTDALEHMVKGKHMQQLKVLEIEESSHGSGIASLIANSKELGGIRTLSLYKCNLDDNGLSVLAASPHLHNLTNLNLAINNIGDEGIASLMESKIADNLERLDLGVNKNIGLRTAQLIANSPRLGKLKTLNLFGANIGNEGVIAITKSGNLPSLEYIDIRFCDNVCPSEGVLALLGATSNLPNLKWIVQGAIPASNTTHPCYTLHVPTERALPKKELDSLTSRPNKKIRDPGIN